LRTGMDRQRAGVVGECGGSAPADPPGRRQRSREAHGREHLARGGRCESRPGAGRNGARGRSSNRSPSACRNGRRSTAARTRWASACGRPTTSARRSPRTATAERPGGAPRGAPVSAAPSIDVVALGHPLVDVLTHETTMSSPGRCGAGRDDDGRRGARTTRSTPSSVRLRRHRADRRRTPRWVSLRSAGRRAFIGRIADDAFGKVFRARSPHRVGVRHLAHRRSRDDRCTAIRPRDADAVTMCDSTRCGRSCANTLRRRRRRSGR